MVLLFFTGSWSQQDMRQKNYRHIISSSISHVSFCYFCK